jgi:Flp pilus assembly protein TadD
VQLKDPTAWMDDLTVFVDDDEITLTAALLEPDLVYRGSHLAASAWLSLVGTAAGSFAAATFSPDIRGSFLNFAMYLAVAFLLLAGLWPLTRRLVGGPIVWHAKTTFFWAALLVCVPVFCAGFTSPWLAYGLSVVGGFFIGMMVGSLAPQCVKREDAWMGASLPLGVLSAVVATFVQRNLISEPHTLQSAVTVGAIAAGLFFAPMSFLLLRFWDEAHGFKRMAMLFLHNDNFAAKAVTYLDNALALTPSDPELYTLRALAWSKMDQRERAAADWARAAELAPEDAEPHLHRGMDHLRRGELDQAMDALGTALKLEPENADAHCHFGAALEQRGDRDGAIARYEKAIALRPDYAKAYANRGHARCKWGEYNEAIDDCDQAIELDPTLPDAYVTRAQALTALGERAGAAETYRALAELQPSPEIQERALRGLEALAVAGSVAK